MQTFWQDLKFALRILVSDKASTTVAVFILALGIGANTAIFTMLKDAVLRPVAGIRNAEQLVVVLSTTRGGQMIPISYPDYRDFRDRNSVFSNLVASSQNPLSVTIDGHPQRLWGEHVSGNYFQVFGVRAALGRVLLPSDNQVPGGHAVAVISHALWQNSFGSDPSVVGKNIHVGTRSFTVVGVTEPGFHGSVPGLSLSLFVPLMMEPDMSAPGGLLEQRNSHWLLVQGPLKEGVTIQQATAAMRVLGEQLAGQYPNEDILQRVALVPLWKSPFGSQQYLFPILSAVMVVAGIVLLVACGNLANLFLARAAARRREMAVRLAVGASRARLVRQLLTESLLVSLLGGVGALIIGLWSNEWFTHLRPPTPFPVVLEANLDLLVFAFTLLVSCASAFLFGLAPALQASKVDLVQALKQNVSGRQVRLSRSRQGLVVWQMALSLILLISAGLVIRSKWNASDIDPGFNVRNVALVSLDLRPNGYDESSGPAFFHRLLERSRSLAEVQSASLATRLPLLVIGTPSRTVEVEGYVQRRDEDMSLAFNIVTPEYFETMRVPVLEGRVFTTRDDRSAADVVVVNETMARHFWPGTDALGRGLRTAGRWRTVVGVVRDIKYLNLTEAPRPYLYLPLAQNYSPDMTLHVRTAADPVILLKTLESEVRKLDPNLPVFGVRTMAEHVQFSLAGYTLAVLLLTRAGLLGLLLASVGLYGVISYSVTQRRHEIGVRMALGALPGDVLRMILGQAARLALLGTVLGLGAATMVTRLLARLLYGVSPTDPGTFIAVAALLLTVALLACFLPARRATRVDPVQALRWE